MNSSSIGGHTGDVFFDEPELDAENFGGHIFGFRKTHFEDSISGANLQFDRTPSIDITSEKANGRKKCKARPHFDEDDELKLLGNTSLMRESTLS